MTTISHGVSFLPDCRPEKRSATDYYADVLAISRLADEAGFDYVKMTEHYLHPYGGYCPSPLTFLAAVAARTTRIRLTIGSRTDDDGYIVRFVPDMTLTLTRVSRHTRIVTLPPGVSPG